MSDHTDASCCTPPAALSKAELDMIMQFLQRVPLQGQEAFTYCQLLARIDAVRRTKV